MAATKQVALVTGANTGIGLAVANKLAREHGFHVFLGSRKVPAGEAAAAAIVRDGFAATAVELDLTSDAHIAAVAEMIRRDGGVLDVLVNNAGVSLDLNGYTSTRALYEETFQANVFGAAALTEACLPLLHRAALPRLIFVSSTMGSITRSLDKTTAWYDMDFKAYDASKAALNMIAVNYARILGDKGMSNAVCPGLVKTKLNGYMEAGTDTDTGAERITQLATAGKDGPTGTFSSLYGTVPW